MDNSFHMKPLWLQFSDVNICYKSSLQDIRGSRILLCRMKGGPAVISSTTPNGFVILFDLGATQSFAAVPAEII